MACQHHHHHLQNNHQSTANTCCCHPLPPPQPPCVTTDPLVVAAIVSQLLQTPSQNPQTPLNFFSQPIKPTNLNPKQRYPHRESDQFQFQHPYSVFGSLLQRIDALEGSLHRFSSSSCFSLRDAAARTIQTHFRSYLVHRSRTLRQLKDLASIKSRISCLKSSFSRRGIVDFDSFSRKATDLLLQLDTIESGDQMIRDSKRSITREIVQFLEMVDGVCVRRHQVLSKTMKNMRMMRNDCRTSHDGRVSFQYGLGSKCESVSSNDRKLIANLRERVERIGRMSKALQDAEVDDAEIEVFESLDNDEHDIIDPITNNYGLQNLGSVKKNSRCPNAKKRVCFVEDGNVVRAYDVDGNIRSTFRDIDEIEDSSKGRQDEEETAESDVEQYSLSSKDGKNHIGHQDSHHNQDGEFTFSAPEPVKMEARVDLVTRKPGVKIVG